MSDFVPRTRAIGVIEQQLKLQRVADKIVKEMFTDYPCRVCNKIFRHKRSAVRHMRKAHRVDYSTSWIFILFLKLTGRTR